MEIHAIVHGSQDDDEWVQAEKAMRQASEDMGVDFYFSGRTNNFADNNGDDGQLVQQQLIDLTNTTAVAIAASESMAAEIRALIRYELDDSDHGHSHSAVKQIDGLVVTISDEIVLAAVEDAIQAGIHVFGFDTGYALARDNPNILGYVAQDEYLAGQLATAEFSQRRLNAYGDPEYALFVNHDANDPAMRERFRGFNDSLYESYGIVAEEMVVDAEDFYNMILTVDQKMKGCQYDFVLLSGAEVVPAVASAFEHHVCEDYDQQRKEKDVFGNGTIEVPDMSGSIRGPRPLMVASFDETREILDSIVLGQLEFTLSPQKYLMSVLPVIFATVFASTGKKLELPDELENRNHIYYSGPEVIDSSNMPPDTLLQCQEESFPVCPKDGSGTQTICPCTNRKDVRIAGVVHGVVGDIFWDEVFAGANQAGLEMDITLELERFDSQESDAVLHTKMAAKIRTLCGSGVDGIFVSMPSETLEGAVRFCRQLRIPILIINAGLSSSMFESSIQHIGQIDYKAGRESAERLLQEDTIIEGYCVILTEGKEVLERRCQGFQDVLNERNVTYGGTIEVPMDSELQYYQNIADAVGGDPFGSWDGIGLVIAGPLQPALHVKEHHPGLTMGKFDVTGDIFEALDDGRLLFAIDQQQYLQGSMAVYLLSYAAFTKQSLLNNVIETGPTLIDHSPSGADQFCAETLYPVCSRAPKENYSYVGQSWLIFGFSALAIICFASLVSLIWMQVYRSKNVVMASQPLFLYLLVFGVILSTCAIIPMSAQTGYRYLEDPITGKVTDEPNPDIPLVDAACMMAPWFYGIGFSIMFSALCAKVLRVKRIFDAGSQMRKKQVEIKDVMVVMAGMLTAETIILLVWTIMDPLMWHREIAQEFNGYVLESTGRCQSDNGNIYITTQALWHAVCLAFVLLLCWMTADIPTEFAEGSYISLSVLCIFQVSILALPIGYMVQDTPDVFYFVRCAAMFLPNFTVLCLIFCPKMYRVYTGDDVLPLAHVRRNTVPQSTDNSHGANATSKPISAISKHAPESEYDGVLKQMPKTKALQDSSTSSNHGGTVQERALPAVDQMPSLDSESDVEQPTEIQAKYDVYNHLRAGLDGDTSSSSSISSEGPEKGAAYGIGTGLASLAAEISRAEEGRAEVLSDSHQGESVPSNVQSLVTTNAPETEGASYVPLVVAAAVTAATIRQFKRQDSPDIDSSVESSSNDGAAVNALDDALGMAGNLPREMPDSSESDSSTEPSSVNRKDASQNPQEGFESPDRNAAAKVGPAADNAENSENDQMESESPSITAASPQGISRAEASLAEIFRLPREPAPHDTPIRLKKAPEAYGENAKLALGMTKTSGSFLRKVAASFGSASVTSSSNGQRIASLGSKSTTLQSPPRIHKTGLARIPSDNNIRPVDVERSVRPNFYKALRGAAETTSINNLLDEADAPSSSQADTVGEELHFL